ncbi:MAG TPA: hypothetical protein IAB87_03735, partial [Candidatus Coprenecus merdipullorum]|nr:hypothetical protein [Candidatus Coprenecus merdipullorum]
RKDNAAQKVCREGAAEKVVPQRQRIARFAAVVEEGRKHNAAQRACSEGAAKKAIPQRHRIAENGAIAEQ